MTETNFKHTDLGLIPHDWEVKTIEDVAQTSSGGTPSRSVPAYFSGDIRWFTTGELCDGMLYDSIEHITPEALSLSSAKLFKEGTLLMAMYGATIGKLGILSKPSTTNQACCAIMCNDVKTEYLFYQLLFHREAIIAMGRGAGQPNISQDIVKRLSIPLPPTLAEQERIAGALSSIDTLIGALTEQIEKKRHIKQGAMQQLLTGKKRLAGFTGEWIKRCIWEVTIWDKKFNGIEDYKQPEVRKYPYALAQELLSMEDNNGDVFLLSTGSYSGWTTEEKAGEFLCEGEVVTIPWGGVANVKYTKGKFVTADNRLATSNNIQVLSNKFLYLAMLLRTDVINSFYRGASIKHPSMEDVLNLEITFPPTIEEQNAISDILSNMDTEIAALEQKRDKYIAIKSGMMQNLLTGKIRLV